MRVALWNRRTVIVTWVLSVVAASFSSCCSFMLVLVLALLTDTLSDPLRSCTAAATSGLSRAHPGQRSSSHPVVAMGHWASEGQRHACIWGKQTDQRVNVNHKKSSAVICRVNVVPSLKTSLGWESCWADGLCLCLRGLLCVIAGLMLLSVDRGLLGRCCRRPGSPVKNYDTL